MLGLEGCRGWCVHLGEGSSGPWGCWAPQQLLRSLQAADHQQLAEAPLRLALPQVLLLLPLLRPLLQQLLEVQQRSAHSSLPGLAHGVAVSRATLLLQHPARPGAAPMQELRSKKLLGPRANVYMNG